MATGVLPIREGRQGTGSMDEPAQEDDAVRTESKGATILNWHTWLKENLRPDQFERLDAYDVQILYAMMSRARRLKTYERKGFKHLSHLKIAVCWIYSEVHAEMGGITEAQIYERIKKLEDMALLRTYVVFNRDMPEDLQ